MKLTLLTVTALFIAASAFAQKQTYDIVSYTVPRGWQSQHVDGGVQLFITDSKTGGYAIAIVTKSMASTGSAEEDFTSQWNSLLVKTVNSITEPVKIEPAHDEGWEIHSGNGNYVDGNVKGLATLITATGYDQTVAAVLMTNTQQYQNDLLTFINSLELKKFQQKNIQPVTRERKTSNTNQNNTSQTLAGSWSYSASEKLFGTLSPGYSTKQYTFNEDGTYTFLFKFFSSTMSVLIFQYERGNYRVNGNQLTISPLSGANEEWSKHKTHPDQWGTRLKTSQRKLEKTTYTFTLHYFSGIQETNLILQASQPTEREGSFSNLPDYPNGWSFKPCNTTNNPVIVTPTGFKNDTESKTNPTSVNTVNSPLTGKVWEAKSYEKYPGGAMSYHTGGHLVHQYVFNANGTYRFVYVGASAYTELNILKYETGTYTLNGNQLTLTPTQGNNEEWSVLGGPVKLSGMSETQVRKIKESWNKRIKSTQRKLEKNVYTFRIEYLQGNEVNALILEYNRATERESNGSVAYYFETPTAKSIVLPKLN